MLDFDLQRQLYDHLQHLKPLPSVYDKAFIAANQEDRADNLISGKVQLYQICLVIIKFANYHFIKGNRKQQLEEIRRNIRAFKTENKLEKVIILWTANTERFHLFTSQKEREILMYFSSFFLVSPKLLKA